MLILKKILVIGLLILLAFGFNSNSHYNEENIYKNELTYFNELTYNFINNSKNYSLILDSNDIINARKGIQELRYYLKKSDFWLRYLDPVEYRKINGPLLVEWETEVFEKFEKPYRREGGGLFLAMEYLNNSEVLRDSLQKLMIICYDASNYFLSDSICNKTQDRNLFVLANRLFLMNLASIYTTGFECPDRSKIIKELIVLLTSVEYLYKAYKNSNGEYLWSNEYLLLYKEAIDFVEQFDGNIETFDHFKFLSKFIDPLFRMNQELIIREKAFSESYNEYSVNNNSTSLFDKSLFNGQDLYGVYRSVKDSATLVRIKNLGRQFFYDPVFSKNNKRACASCHKPSNFFTDTSVIRPRQFDQKGFLSRNAPGLFNIEYNHLLMLDGRHHNILEQMTEVVNNSIELNSSNKEIQKKIFTCSEYKTELSYISKLVGLPKSDVKLIFNAISLYLSDFSKANSSFDRYFINKSSVDSNVIKGFNLFMGKAKCGTCHFVPQFNGIKPPYISSEFEVIGVPEDTTYQKISSDSGRYSSFKVEEMLHAFRTPTIRNIEFTKPYMHNGIFQTLEEVIEHYNQGGAVGKNLELRNQTLPSVKLNLSIDEKDLLIQFMRSLSEEYYTEPAPKLPYSNLKYLNNRIAGGEY